MRKLSRVFIAVDHFQPALTFRREIGKAVKDEAAAIFDDPALRRLLKDVKAAADIRIDTISTDAVVSSGWRATHSGRRSR